MPFQLFTFAFLIQSSSYDLPPTALAHPLPAFKSPAKTQNPNAPNPHRRRKIQKRNALEDDTPHAFKRLMTGRKPLRGLDDGPPPKKQRPNSTPALPTPIANSPDPSPPTLKIKPSESLSSFSARVNAALPIINFSRSNRAQDPVGIKRRQTKTEKRIQRMQQEWREAAQRRKEREEAALDEAELESSDEATPQRKPKRKHSHSRLNNNNGNDNDENPWSIIALKRASQVNKPTGLVGLHDVVLAPPKLLTPKQTLRDSSTRAKPFVGGLRRQEELGEARKRVVEGYRQMMKERGRAG